MAEADKSITQRTACLIVPAFNEAGTVASVLKVASESGIFSTIVCVDDGSRDDTADAARTIAGVTVISQKNAGKAMALKAGLDATSEPVVTFLDADLLNLKHEHIRALVEPVTSGTAKATIGIFKGGRGPTDFAQKIAPMISGQRALLRSLMADFEGWQSAGFGIEHALNDHLKSKGVKMLEVAFEGASHLMKEEKHGLLSGFVRRLKMYAEIARYNLRKPR
ncbi:MAG: glycosyltransferase [bacterium]